MPDGVAGCLNARADEQLCDLGGESYRASSGVQPEAAGVKCHQLGWEAREQVHNPTVMSGQQPCQTGRGENMPCPGNGGEVENRAEGKCSGCHNCINHLQCQKLELYLHNMPNPLGNMAVSHTGGIICKSGF